MFSYCMPILTDQQGRKNELKKTMKQYKNVLML